MPITRGSTPATAEPTNAPSGSTPSSRALSSLAITSAAAPSLIPLALPGGHGALGAKRRLELREHVGSRLRSRMLVDDDLTDRDELVVEAARCVRQLPALLRASGERVLILARHAPLLGDVLARLPHRLQREHLLEPWVGEAPAERRVPQRPVATRERRVRLRRDERRAAHRLDATGDDDLGVTCEHGVTGGHDRRQTRGAETVQRDTCDRLRKAGEKRGHPRDVAVVLARLVRAAEVDVVDRAAVDRGSLHRGGDGDPREIVRPHARERTRVPPDRRANRGENDCARHRGDVTGRSRSRRAPGRRRAPRRGGAAPSRPCAPRRRSPA